MWRERGLTMVFVTHDSSVARRAQRIGVMKNGRLTIKQKASSRAARATAARPQPAEPEPEPEPADSDSDSDSDSTLAASASASDFDATLTADPATTDSISFPD
jgi:ABC-type glutathione transport system ATPase component